MLIAGFAVSLAVGLLGPGVSSVVSTANGECPKEVQAALGYCPSPDNDGSGVIIDGHWNDPGRPGSPGTPIYHGDPGGDRGDDGGAPIPDDFDFGRCYDDWEKYIGCFRDGEPEEEEGEPTPGDPGMPPVTIDDVARFAPEPTTVAGEPGNAGIADMPTNFVATASAHSESGSLFGYPITVRFTPSGFDFHYGDGTTASTTTGGQTWADLGQAQFTPTDTSHVYAERGTYTARVDVRYTAEIDLGIGWFPIDGELTAVGPDQEIRIFEAHTALVASTCEQNPDAPGC